MATDCNKDFTSTNCNNEQVCSPFSLGSDPANCLMAGFVAEHLNIGAAPINVFKLLGIHEQGRLIDLTGKGTAVSSGEYPQFPASNAFANNTAEWRSTQKGNLVTQHAYIGYDFGPILLDNGRLRYGIETEVRQHITTIKIRQACVQKNRVTKVRVERSDDNITWYGVAILTLPDNEDTNQLSVKQSAAARYWRLRPLAFNGGPTDFWGVVTLELIDYASTQLSNIQDDNGFLENRDRNYASESLMIKGFYDLQEAPTDLSRFGIDMSQIQEYTIKVAFDSVVSVLGRPIVIGDILEIPSETQYTPELVPVKKYLEVSDVMWSAEGFTPGWKPTIQRIVAKPMIASQETRDIIGDLNLPNTTNDFAHLDQSVFNTESLFSDQKIVANTNTQVPENGGDSADVRQFTSAEVAAAADRGINISKLNINPRAIYVEDGLPPNGLPYTEGPAFPTKPKDLSYHRLTYVGLKDPIPPRLYRWSVAKNNWIFVEEDKRMRYNVTKPSLQDFLQDPLAIPASDVQK
jgi:hypothetical protein